MNAVHSEFFNNFNSDARRVNMVLKKQTKKDHPYSKFFVGNLETLNHPSIRDDVMKFHK